MLMIIPYLLIAFVLPVLLSFIFLTLKYQKIGIYIAGALTTFLLYFLYAEAFVYFCNAKLWVFDPFAEGYTFLLVNLQYYWPWYLGLILFQLLLGIQLSFKVSTKK